MVVLAFAGFGASVPACAKRDLACPDFDACAASAECPLVRCVCDVVSVTSPPTCRGDGTCTTTVDCVEVCAGAKASCAKPPEGCLSFIPTECACGDGSKSFAAAWDCANGVGDMTSSKDCDVACDNPTTTTVSSGGLTSTGSL